MSPVAPAGAMPGANDDASGTVVAMGVAAAASAASAAVSAASAAFRQHTHSQSSRAGMRSSVVVAGWGSLL